jgi:hypothetical protein
VNNGGFHQYYTNSPGDRALVAGACLQELGAPHTAQLLSEANAVFGAAGPHTDRDRREQQVDALGDGARAAWFALDDRFYEYRDNLSALAAAFIRAHQASFTD